MKADLAARGGAPITGDLVHLGPGLWCDGTAGAGELSTQGVVELDGVRGRFDQVVGLDWMIVGLGADPATALRRDQLAALSRLGGRTVVIGDESVRDVDGTYLTWMTEIGATFFIARPDFYVAATAATGEELCEHWDVLLGKLGLNA